MNDLLLKNNHDYSVSARMIDLLLQAYLWDNRDYFVYDEIYYEKIPLSGEKYKQCVAQQLREQIIWFYKFADTADAKVHIIKDFYLIYLAEVELVAGNLQNAYQLFSYALNSRTLKTANMECKKDEASVAWCLKNDTVLMVVSNMCQILACLGCKEETKALMKEYASLIQYARKNADDVYRDNPNNPYAKIKRNLYYNMNTPMTFTFHNYDEYLEIENVANNLYDKSMFNGDVTDSTFITYVEMKKVTISNNILRIAAITNLKYPHTSLDYQQVVNANKEKLQSYLS